MNQEAGIFIEAAEGIMTITMDRRQAMNALHPPAHFAMAEALTRFDADDTLRVAIITGAGERAFCAGSDLKERLKSGKDDLPATGFGGICERFDLTKPVIAAINGDCVGGGLEIVMACDLAISAEHARFGLPEPRVGLAASGGLHRLARQIPLKQAMEIALTGRFFSAGYMMRIGMINEIVPDAHSARNRVNEIARELIQCAPLSLMATKQMMLAGRDAASLSDAFHADYPAYERMLASKDALEGQMAFAEKRAPRWRGR